MTKATEEMLTINEAAATAGVSVETLYKAMQRGRLTYQTKYGRKLVTRQALDTWQNTRKMGRPPKK